jgi:hypothetical protein
MEVGGGDYRLLNSATTADKYTLPNVQDFSTFLHGATIFSKITLEKGYHQIPMNEADISKTAIITPFGLFEFLFMPFGLANAGQTFQQLMDSLFHSFPFIFIYLDDILVVSHSRAEHLGHLDTALATLAANGLHINPAKSHFSTAAGGIPRAFGHCHWHYATHLACPANFGISSTTRCQIIAKTFGNAQFLPPFFAWHRQSSQAT